MGNAARPESAESDRLTAAASVWIQDISSHPAAGSEHVPLGPNPGDLAGLLSPAVRAVIEARALELASCATLKEVG